MSAKRCGWITVVAAAISVAIAAPAHFAISQERGSEFTRSGGESGGTGGGGGNGAGGGRGGSGGAGGSGYAFGGQTSSRGNLAAFGDYVYVVYQGELYQYTAYDFELVTHVKVNDHRGAAGGRGGRGGDGGQDGENGEDGGAAMGSGSGGDLSIAAYGDYVFVFDGAKMHKFAVAGLKPIKNAKLRMPAASL